LRIWNNAFICSSTFDGLICLTNINVQFSTSVSNTNIKGQKLTKNQLSWVYLCAVELIDGEKYCWAETVIGVVIFTQKHLYFSINVGMCRYRELQSCLQIYTVGGKQKWTHRLSLSTQNFIKVWFFHYGHNVLKFKNVCPFSKVTWDEVIRFCSKYQHCKI
jgi:hypothetical protein